MLIRRGLKACFIFVVVSITAWSAHGRGRCVISILEIVEKTRAKQSFTRIPIGMNLESMNELLQIFKEDQAFSSSDVIVLYGSRTHFTLGYQPKSTSDLDVAIFYTDSQQAIINHDKANESLNGISNELGFNIREDIPMLRSLENLLQEKELQGTDVSEINRSTRLVDRLAREGSWDPIDYRKVSLTLQSEEHMIFNLEAIFIFKTPPSLNLIRALRRNGYSNFIYLSS